MSEFEREMIQLDNTCPDCGHYKTVGFECCQQCDEIRGQKYDSLPVGSLVSLEVNGEPWKVIKHLPMTYEMIVCRRHLATDIKTVDLMSVVRF